MMNPNLEAVLDVRLARTAENLRKNNMDAVIVKNKAEALDVLRSYLFDGCTIGVGGSATLDELDALVQRKFDIPDEQ